MKYAKTALLLVIIIACIAFIHFSGHFDLYYLQQHSRYLLSMVHAHYGVASLIYLLLLAGTVFIGIPITMPLCLIGGYLFGLWHSILYSLISIMTGSIAYFMVMRFIVLKANASIPNNNNSPSHTTDSSHNTYTSNSNYINNSRYAKYLQQFKDSIHTHGIWYLLFLHFIHIVPYIAINTLAVLANIPLTTFAISTFIGAIPAVGIYSYTGQKITTLNSISDIWQPSSIFLFLLLIGFTLLPILFRKRSLRSQ